MKAAEGLPLDAAELALFREVAGDRDPPARRVREMWCVAGRRAGKDSVASSIATIASIQDYSKFLRPGERGVVMCLAARRDQAEIVHRYITANFNENPLLSPLIARQTSDELELTNGVSIISTTNSFRGVRGRTIVCAILDEVAFWADENSANPDVEVYNALRPAMATIPTSMLIGISTPYRRSGLLYQKWREHFGKDGDKVLVIHGTSRQFNTATVTQEEVDEALARDPEAMAAEYLCEWRTDVGDFLDRELIEGAVDRGVTVRPPQPSTVYTAFADPSGGRGDSFTIAIAHDEGGVAVLDCLYEKRAPFDPASTVAEIAELLRSYGVPRIVGDKYAASWVPSEFSKHGIVYDPSTRDRSAVYLDALPLFAAGRVRLIDDRRMVHQFTKLERKTSAFGRDRIDHPRDGADDAANAAAGALTLAASDGAPSLLKQADMLVEGKPVPMPRWTRSVDATMWVAADGTCATCYFASHAMQGNTDPPQLVLVDLDVSPLTSATVPRMFARLEELHRAIPRCIVHLAWVPQSLLPHLHLMGFDGAEAYPPDSLRDIPALAVSASAHIANGKFKIAEPAAEKGRTLPLAGALAYRPGEAIESNPLRMAILLAIDLILTPDTIDHAPVLPAARFGW